MAVNISETLQTSMNWANEKKKSRDPLRKDEMEAMDETFCLSTASALTVFVASILGVCGRESLPNVAADIGGKRRGGCSEGVVIEKYGMFASSFILQKSWYTMIGDPY